MDLHPVWGPVSLALLALGVLWWLAMGVMFGRFADVGVYAVAAMLLGFGATGLWASKRLPRDRHA